MKKNIIFYLLVIGIFGTLLILILDLGKKLEPSHLKFLPPSSVTSEVTSELPQIGFFEILQDFYHHLHHPFALLILQLLVVVIATRFLGWVMIHFKQPTVIGEIIAGILLGPSLLGMCFPEFYHFLFPPESLKILEFFSQLGLILFMFIIGIELDISILKKSTDAAIVISHVSIVFPYFLGSFLAYFIYESYAPENIAFQPFALFMGIAMSITAFPVLARIVQERGIAKTPVGTISITCAAADDVTAWCILALVISIVKAGGVMKMIATIITLTLYLCFMLFLVKPLIERIAKKYFAEETISRTVLGILFSILLISSFLTEVIGIHALFGAFLAGVIIPANPQFRQVLIEKIEDVSLVLLLPLFFVIVGLRTQIGLLNQFHLWVICFVIIAVAVFGKFVGSALTAKFVGLSWKDSLIIGALMNTRGLMELVVLNIGYDLGVLSKEIFAMMVLMALTTTFMTGPILDLIEFLSKKRVPKIPTPKTTHGLNILISFGRPDSGSRLLQLAKIFHSPQYPISVTALHISPNTDISLQEAERFEKEGFEPILEEAEQLQLKIKPVFKVSHNISGEVIHCANEENIDLLLVGPSQLLFSDDQTGGTVRTFFEEAHSRIGVFIDKGFEKIENVLFIVDSEQENFLATFKKMLTQDPNKKITLLDNQKVIQKNPTLWEIDPLKNTPSVQRIETSTVDEALFQSFDLVILSLYHWEKNPEMKTQNIVSPTYPSLLILR